MLQFSVPWPHRKGETIYRVDKLVDLPTGEQSLLIQAVPRPPEP